MSVGVFARNFGNIGNAYDEYGFAYCFSNSLFNSGIDKPKEYNENTIRDILARMDELESERDEYRSERDDMIEEESRQQAAESESGTEENTDLPGEAESIKETDAVKQENTNKATKERPNIIFLQLESLFDPQLLKDVEFSGTVLPKLEWLYKSYPSGFLSVPSVGAGTANTEFEIISGMNLDDFGPGEYPYKTKLKNQVCESAATAF